MYPTFYMTNITNLSSTTFFFHLLNFEFKGKMPHLNCAKYDLCCLQGSILDWISIFLKSRDQCVVVDGEKSESAKFDSIVPQGTLLRPPNISSPYQWLTRYCTIYNPPLCWCLVYREMRTMEDQIVIQKYLNTLVEWAKSWKLLF